VRTLSLTQRRRAAALAAAAVVVLLVVVAGAAAETAAAADAGRSGAAVTGRSSAAATVAEPAVAEPTVAESQLAARSRLTKVRVRNCIELLQGIAARWDEMSEAFAVMVREASPSVGQGDLSLDALVAQANTDAYTAAGWRNQAVLSARSMRDVLRSLKKGRATQARSRWRKAVRQYQAFFEVWWIEEVDLKEHGEELWGYMDMRGLLSSPESLNAYDAIDSASVSILNRHNRLNDIFIQVAIW
jgi:hypothetical protein